MLDGNSRAKRITKAVGDKMKILILGSEGSMGKRYSACLRYLKHDFDTYDTSFKNSLRPDFDKYTHIAICTPTITHFRYLRELIPLNKNILCEKPISKDLVELSLIKKMLANYKSKLVMMLQYSMIVGPSIKTGSHYNYYKTGNDGLYWDCLQILHLSNDLPKIENTSPIWSCMINGRILSIARMDEAYIMFLQEWVNDKITQDFDRIIRTHQLAKRLQDECDRKLQGCNSDPGAK